jgi:hypothetical protein
MIKKSLSSEERLEHSLNHLAKVAERLPKDLGFPRNPFQYLVVSFLKGIAYGFGALVAVAVVVPLVISVMRSVNWVPIIGNFVADIATQMEVTRGSIPLR